MAEVNTVRIVGKKGRLIVNEVDLPDWQKKGYRLESEVAEEKASKKSEKDNKGEQKE